MDPEKTVSQRKFAEMVGKSEGAVRKAIARGSIQNGVVDGKILPSVAASEWGVELISSPATDNTVVQDTAPVSPENEAISTELNLESPEKAKFFTVPIDGIQTENPEAEKDDEAVSESELIAPIEEYTTKVKAERLIAVYKARKAQAEWLETIGDLVRKGVVYDKLYEFATEIRQNLMNVPSRCTSMVRAADTDREAEMIMETEIHAALTALSDTSAVKITK